MEKPTKTLTIAAPGIRLVRFPTPDPALVTAIFSSAFSSLVYTSTRAKRSSGTCTLSKHVDGQEVALVKTEYRFGPGRDPRIEILADSGGGLDVGWDSGSDNDDDDDDTDNADNTKKDPIITVEKTRSFASTTTIAEPGSSSKVERARWFTRAQRFTFNGQVYQWRYEKDGEMVLTRIVADGNNGGEGTVLVARMERDTGNDAGRGGKLVLIALDEATALEEAVVVATCLVMLKKEVDRRRRMQFIVLSAGAGGGSS